VIVPVPPLPDEETVPVQSPLQSSSVALAVTVSTGGVPTVAFAVTVHPLASVTVTV